jgi:hypothetical protein
VVRHLFLRGSIVQCRSQLVCATLFLDRIRVGA